MDTSKITCLCNKSNRIFENRKRAEQLLNVIYDVTYIAIESRGGSFSVRIKDYPELKSTVQKILELVVESEETKQTEIKEEIAECL